MNKKDSLLQLGWDEDLIEAFKDSFEQEPELPSYETEFTTQLIGTTEVFVQIQMPMSVSGQLGHPTE